jgi:glucose-6-phosphate dehydrogenase assembly protein OpcA
MSETATPPADRFLVSEAIPVDLARVDTALTQLWKRQEPVPGSSDGFLTRACMSNLIIVCKGREEAETVSKEVDEIVARHPSRVILMAALEDAGAEGLQASVSARCHLGKGSRQICSEVVAIGARGDDVRKLPSAARSLLVGDLPTSLWWDRPEPPVPGDGLFGELLGMVDQVVYSSLRWTDPIAGTIATAGTLSKAGPGGPVMIDLAWRALRPWRQLISQAIDPTALPGAFDALETIEIEHGPHGLPQAWLLAGWFTSALGWVPTERTVERGREVSWRFRAPGREVALFVRRLDEGEPEVRRVVAGWRCEGCSASLRFQAGPSGHLEVIPEGLNAETRVLATPRATRAALVGEELQQLEPDRVFLRAVEVSRSLAENLVLR